MRRANLPKTAEDVKAMLAISESKGIPAIITEAAEERDKRIIAEKEIERLKRKISRNPAFLREGFERALAQAGETPAEGLVRLAYEKDPKTGRYVLDPKDRKDILKSLLPYSLPAYKAQETKKDGDTGVKFVIQNFVNNAPAKKPEPSVVVESARIEEPKAE